MTMEWLQSIPFWTLTATLFWLAGIGCALHALMSVRSERATVAWCIGLMSMPFVAVPFYLIFGRRSFNGYRSAISAALEEHRERIEEAMGNMAKHRVAKEELESPLLRSLSAINRYPFSRENRFELLVDGGATFDAIGNAIRSAEDYILFQFYIIRDDGLGRRLKDALLERARSGVRVYFLYDEVGSGGLPKVYKEELKAAGCEVEEFGTRRGRSNRFQVNFRNHRKIVVVDGEVAFVGGHNVGDEYLGLDDTFGHWRDTHVEVRGPAALECQGVFLQDWWWATREIPQVRTDPVTAPGGHLALVMPSGPTDDLAICQLTYQILIGEAKQRIWIASPYFVPDEATLVALKYAAARGVDVRVMIPAMKDHLVVWLAAFSYFEEMEAAGVQLLRYTDGFMHQKAFLVDDLIAGVGTVNLDERSFRLNFEVMALSCDPDFARAVAEMFQRDFESCQPAKGSDYHDRGFLFRFGVRCARLFSPIL